mgnify:CR=1 FL=1
MLDIKLIRTEPDFVKAALRKREMDLDSVIDEILLLDEQRRAIIAEAEAMKAKQNAVSKQVPILKKEGKDATAVLAEMKALSEEVKVQEAKLAEVEQAQTDRMLQLPNLPDEDVVAGGKEQNQVLRTFGATPEFPFQIKNHMALCEDLGLIDYTRGAKLVGHGAWRLRVMGTRIGWALPDFFVDGRLKAGH